MKRSTIDWLVVSRFSSFWNLKTKFKRKFIGLGVNLEIISTVENLLKYATHTTKQQPKTTHKKKMTAKTHISFHIVRIVICNALFTFDIYKTHQQQQQIKFIAYKIKLIKEQRTVAWMVWHGKIVWNSFFNHFFFLISNVFTPIFDVNFIHTSYYVRVFLCISATIMETKCDMPAFSDSNSFHCMFVFRHMKNNREFHSVSDHIQYIHLSVHQ